MMQERSGDNDNPFLASASASYHPHSSNDVNYGDFASTPRSAPNPNSPYRDHTQMHQQDSYATSASYLGGGGEHYRDDPHYGGGSGGGGGYPYPPAASPNTSGMLLPTSGPPQAHLSNYPSSPSSSRRRKMIIIGLVAVLLIAAAVVIPLYFFVIKKNSDDKDSGGSGKDGDSKGAGGKNVVGAVRGGDGSTVTMANGESFVYKNEFGGYWLADPANPFLTGAKPNSWTPALNESWTWGVDRVYGVNLGGWFVLEPFISPALFQAYPSAPDEWTLAALMRADGTLQSVMEKHYDTFITEKDIAQIAGAGLNWVRVPIPFWAISTWDNVGTDGNGTTIAEPYLEGVCWKYIVRLFGWARKYGLRVNLDLHTAPGSQNGYNHSGKLGQINFLKGPMGLANAQRMLDYIRVILEFIAQPEYQELIPMFGIMNEAFLPDIGRDVLTTFYLHVHDMIRGITGIGEGKGPYISIHDGFQGVASWKGFLPGSDRIIMDTHPYFAFDQQPNDAPIATSTDPALAGGTWPKTACSAWGASLNHSRVDFGVTVAGEFSNGYNDCGLYLTGVNGSQHYGGDCNLWLDSTTWNDTTKAGVKQFALASMDATQDWFFWTWKIGPAIDGVVRSPLWSYQLGLENGFMPTDPRDSKGVCASLGETKFAFQGNFSSWATGGAGAGTIAPTAIQSFGAWPPATLSNVEVAPTLLPTYTATASIVSLTFTMPAPSASASGSGAAAEITAKVGNGWYDPQDQTPMVTTVAGCGYPFAYSALSSAVPPVCTGSP
ncbi:glycoside hydrolase family 5 protein [Favolaschia claudopus]|uniref:glucan 1,3-beta-glucosidase n=1 Tax=Favolaschia claudopus TaxID=2862362 RepID=A0AAW0D3Y4_9AGAR